MKITIVRQYDTRLKPIGELTKQNWQQYADRHGYDVITNELDGELAEANRMKLVAVRDSKLYVSRADWFFWADADTAVSNPTIMLESFVSNADKNHHLIFDVSHYGLSTGNFFARNTTLAYQLLSAAITCGDPSAEVNARFATINGHDESTMKLLIESFPFFQRHVTTVKIADFPKQHTKDSFILHASQRTEEERIKLLSPYCQ